jgi:predicted metal-dependent peptidase
MSTSLHPQLQRCYDLAIKGAWAHPFFLIPLGHVEWKEGNPEITKTMAISSQIKQGKPEINLFINTDWVKGLPDDQVFGVLCHEILHALLQHHERGGGKNAETWGQAADMAINAGLELSSIKLPPSALLPPKDRYEDAAEELYTLLDQNQIPKPRNYDPDKATQGCMPQPGSQGQEPGQEGQGDQQGQGSGSGDGQGDGEGQGRGEGQGSEQKNQRAWGEMIAQAQSVSRGTGSAKVMARLFKPKPIKTQWQKLLNKVARRANARGGRDNQTFTRINRRSFESDFTLPGWQSNRPAIAAIVDSSGSVSHEQLRSAITSVKECVKISGVRCFLALHDGSCYYGDWITPETSVEALSALCTQRGGTDPRQAFERVGQAKGRFDACVYLTDGEVGEYPAKPQNVKRMIIGIVGESTYRTECPQGWQEVLVVVGDGE